MKLLEIKEKDIMDFVKQCKQHIANVDKIMIEDKPDKYKLLEKESNRFEFLLDSFLHFNLKLDFKKINKLVNKE